MNATATKQVQIPSFTIKDKDGNVPESLKHGFIVKMLININDPPATIRAANGQLYQAVYDNVVFKKGSTICATVVSFQSHTYGNFAIIRNERVPTELTTKDKK